jgi:membrane dipeptidase
MKIRQKNFAILAGVFVCSLFSPSIYSEESVEQHALRIHKEAIVVDAHSDTPLRLVDQKIDIGVRSIEGDMDIPRLCEGGIDAQVFAAWVDPNFLPNNAIKRAIALLDGLTEQIAKYPDKIEIALTATDVRNIVSENKIAAILAVEGGHAIEDDLAVLRTFYKLGVRYMTLTWMNTNNWADAAGDIAKWGGLTEFGVKVVKEMNRLGMLVDVSHVSDETFWDVLQVSSDPVIASHSCCRALCKHFRNLSDDMLKVLAENGGVLCINFYNGYLDSEYTKQWRELNRELKPLRDSLKKKYADDRSKVLAEYRPIVEKKKADRIRPVPLDKLIDHIDYAVKVAGIDHVGLGSDFDGVSDMPVGLEDCTGVPKITEALVRRGYSDEEIRKILGENFLRVFTQVTEK